MDIFYVLLGIVVEEIQLVRSKVFHKENLDLNRNTCTKVQSIQESKVNLKAPMVSWSIVDAYFLLTNLSKSKIIVCAETTVTQVKKSTSQEIGDSRIGNSRNQILKKSVTQGISDSRNR